MKESTLKKNCTARIRQRGGWAKSVAGGPTQAGHPDFYFFYRGYGGGVETKLPGKEGTLTKLQAATLQGIKDGGGIALVVSSVKQVDALLDTIDKKKGNKVSR